MKLSRLAGFILFLFFLSVGCSQRPADVLDEDEMVDLLTDIELAEAYFNSAGTGSARIDREQLIESILQKHNVTHAQLDSTLLYYGRNIDDYSRLYEKVEKNLISENGKLEELNEGNDIWPYSKFTAFLPNQATEGITFSIPAAGIEPGNSLEWWLRLSRPEEGEAVLGVEYENGVTTTNTKSLSGFTAVRIGVQTDTVNVPKRVFGTITLTNPSGAFWADSIHLYRAEFDSLAYLNLRQQRYFYTPTDKKGIIKH